MPARPKSLALLCAAAFLPGLALHAQQPSAVLNEKDKGKAEVITAKPEVPPAKVAAPPVAEAKEASKPPKTERIIKEGMERSQVMKTLGYLTDVIGPRLTGSPGLKRANEWTRDKLAEWGLKDAHLEPWGPFGRGWTLRGFSAQVVEPQCIPLIAFPKAWSVGTEGKVTADLVYFDAKAEADFAKYKGKLKGKVVLSSPPMPAPAHFEAQGKRMTDADLLKLADAPAPGDLPRRLGPTADLLAQMALARKKLVFFIEEGALAVLDPSRTGDGGTIFVAQAAAPRAGGFGLPIPGVRRINVWDKDAPKNIPQVAVAKEHYNRLVRMIEQGESPKIALDLAVEFHDADLMAYNTVAEIPGTDLKDEVVMLGGHMDSWHAGTGATDNAAGVSACMEAVRILKALDLKPRRTIRIALWSGEEEGLFGSRAYVKEHLGDSPAAVGAMMFGGSASAPRVVTKKPDYEKFSAYFNLDNGTGKVRGVYLQGNEAVRPIFRRWLAPFRDLGASTLSISNTGGTDHLAFDGIGLPGFQFIQDEIEYDTRTHHSNQDVFDRIQADDMKQASVILASFVYNTAMRDEKLPRKSPAPAPGTSAGPTAAIAPRPTVTAEQD